MAERLDAVIADAMALNERVRARDDAIKSSRTFLEKAEAAAGAGAGPGAGKGGLGMSGGDLEGDVDFADP